MTNNEHDMNYNWYKVVIHHGPGHQSETIWYRYSTIDFIRDAIDTSHFTCPSVKITKVKKLPDEVKKRKLAEYRSQIKHAKEMVKLIKEME